MCSGAQRAAAAHANHADAGCRWRAGWFRGFRVWALWGGLTDQTVDALCSAYQKDNLSKHNFNTHARMIVRGRGESGCVEKFVCEFADLFHRIINDSNFSPPRRRGSFFAARVLFRRRRE